MGQITAPGRKSLAPFLHHFYTIIAAPANSHQNPQPVVRAPAIKDLLNSGALQLTLFDQRDMASITSPDFPGERLIVCRNPDLAAERSRKREDLLAATEKDLARIKAAVCAQA